MKNILARQIGAVIVLALVFGAVAYFQSQWTATAQFGAQISLGLNQSVTFPDGLTVTVADINDSRCPQGVQCIWAGEVAVTLTLTKGNFETSMGEVRLGELTKKTELVKGYTLALISATPEKAVFTVSEGE